MLTESKKLAGKWFLSGCAAIALGSSGCRSAMPGMNLFGMRSEPSAEALAGTGPTTTYPTPPSATATPEAIASVAGGTAIPVSAGEPASAPARVAGFNSPAANPTSSSSLASGTRSPSGGKNMSATNMGAAQANGFPSSTKPAGYAFGSKTFTPKPDATASPAAADTSVADSSFAPPPSNYALPKNTSEPAVAAKGGGSGFTLPPGVSPALAAAGELPATVGTSETGSVEFDSPSLELPSMQPETTSPSAPSFSTASVSEAITAPSTSLSAPNASLSAPLPSSSPQGYSPGSTAGASQYPSDSSSSSGSYYR